MAMVWMRHGLVTWGTTARESYEATIDLVTRAEKYLAEHETRPLVVQISTPPSLAEKRLVTVAPWSGACLPSPAETPIGPTAGSSYSR